MDEVNWRAFELTGVRLDLVQAVQFARAHGALSPTDQRAQRPARGGRAGAFRLPRRPRTATAIAHQNPGPKKPRSQSGVGQRHEHAPPSRPG